jgi:hypothetical protein
LAGFLLLLPESGIKAGFRLAGRKPTVLAWLGSNRFDKIPARWPESDHSGRRSLGWPDSSKGGRNLVAEFWHRPDSNGRRLRRLKESRIRLSSGKMIYAFKKRKSFSD